MKKGITIIELLITACLMGMIGLTTSSVLARGLKVWKKAQVNNLYQREVQFTLEKITKELRNSFFLTGIIFKGTDSQVTFPTYVNTASSTDTARWEIGTMTYFINTSDKTLMRRKKTYDELFENFQETSAEVVLSHVENFKVQYYYFNSLVKAYQWKDSWDEGAQAPLGLKIVLTVINGKNTEKFSKTTYFLLSLDAVSKNI